MGWLPKAQHIAEIIALVSLQRDYLARVQGGIDEQAGGTKIEVMHLQFFRLAPLSSLKG